MFFNTFFVFLAVSSTFLSAHAHGTITAVTGANGVNGAGFGIIASTPRDGSSKVPFEQDTSVIRDLDIKLGKTGVCGSTKAGGNNDVASQLAAASAAGLPAAAADGTVSMTLHQVNQDGAGPFTCEVSGDGGNTFVAATVTTQVPGKFGLSTAKATDFPLAAQIPAGMACTAGPNGDACIMRCRNPALAGPFGSCVAVSNGSGNSTAAAASTADAATSAVADAATADAATADAATADAATADASTADAATSVAAVAPAATAAAAVAAAPAAAAAAAPAAAAVAAPAAGAKQGGLAGVLAGLKSKLGRDESAPAKRYIVSRVAGRNSGFWLDNQ